MINMKKTWLLRLLICEQTSNLVYLIDLIVTYFGQFEEPVSVAIPHCLQRNIPGREPVIKQLQPTGKWAELPTNDIVIEDMRVLSPPYFGHSLNICNENAVNHT